MDPSAFATEFVLALVVGFAAALGALLGVCGVRMLPRPPRALREWAARPDAEARQVHRALLFHQAREHDRATAQSHEAAHPGIVARLEEAQRFEDDAMRRAGVHPLDALPR